MNLCVRTNFAKKVMFDDRFVWSWESDFGYRLTKLGKMKYVPSAIVYHYHRPTLIKFFRQQFNNALINIFLYWKHKDKILGDHISTTSMALTLGLSFILSFFCSGNAPFSRIYPKSMMGRMGRAYCSEMMPALFPVTLSRPADEKFVRKILHLPEKGGEMASKIY